MTQHPEGATIHLPPEQRELFECALSRHPGSRDPLPRLKNPRDVAAYLSARKSAQQHKQQRYKNVAEECRLWHDLPSPKSTEIVQGLAACIQAGWLQEQRSGKIQSVRAVNVQQRGAEAQRTLLVALLVWIVNHRVIHSSLRHNVQGAEKTAWGRKVSLHDLMQCGLASTIVKALDLQGLAELHLSPPKGEAPYVHLTPDGVNAFLQQWCTMQ